MKWFLALIVVLNILVAAAGLLRQHDPVNIHSHEVSPEMLKVLPDGWQSAANASAPAVASAPVAASMPLALMQTTRSPLGKAASSPAASAPHAAAPKAAAPAAAKKAAPAAPAAAKKTAQLAADKPALRQCAQWGELSATLAERVKDGLAGLHLAANQMDSKQVEGHDAANVRYWVFVPAKNVTASLSSELKGKGFDNYVVQNEGEFHGALSLGLFGKEDGAKALQGKLRGAGFAKAEVVARSKTALTRYEFRSLDDKQLQALTALQKRLTPGLALHTQACGG